MLKIFLGLVFLSVVLVGCGGMDIDKFEATSPRLVLEEYFLGKTRAWGIFEDRFGKVRRQFVVDIEGKWNGKVLVLDEHFKFDDGEINFRQWRITKTEDGHYKGRADDVIGIATGISAGNALNWSYVRDLKTGEGKTLRVKFIRP